MSKHRGTLILVLGILSLIICYPMGFVPWFMGKTDLKAMAAGTMDPEGRTMTNIGMILGIIGSVLFLLGIVLGIVFFAIGGAAAMAGQN